MVWLIITLLGITAGVSITLLVMTKKQIKSMTSNLTSINEGRTNSKVLLSSPNRSLEKLAAEINRSIEKRQQTEMQHKAMDMELRRAIANISHDLRTPLTSIIGYIQLIKDESLGSDERTQYVDIVLERARSLDMLVSSFFELSRLEAGEYGFDLKPVSLPGVLLELMASFYYDFTARNTQPVIDIDENVPNVIADENAVRRIFTNLIQNALKHGGGFMSVSLKRKEDHITACFTNDAPDLIIDDVGHLFERFFTANRMRSGRNTGLGLAITRALAEHMGCSIGAALNDGRLCISIDWRV